jgi:hypothetical protein
MKKAYKISKKQKRELAELARMPGDKIDLTDVPELKDWKNAVVGKFYRPNAPGKVVRKSAKAKPRRRA